MELKRTDPEIIVATPGRLIDVVEHYNLDLSSVEYFVLDEGDRMLDMGFEKDIIKIQEFLTHQKMRSMIFSATVPPFIQNIAQESMENPVMIDLVGDDSAQLPAKLVTKAIITQGMDQKVSIIQKYITENKDKKILIFCDTKRDAQSFEHLKFANFLAIHGDLAQGSRERALEKFRQPGSHYVLVGTDVAARGLDVDDIDCVIQINCREQDSFVHRSGRTARKGKEGLNILFFERENLNFVLNLERDLNIEIQLTNSIDSTGISTSSKNEHIAKLDMQMDKYKKSNGRTLKVDNKARSEILEKLTHPDTT